MKKGHPPKDRAQFPQPWWKAAWARIALIPVLAIWVAIYTYKSTGADELRTKVYQPIYADLVRAEESLQAVSVEKMSIPKAFPELRQTGAFERIPSPLQRRLLKVFEEEPKIHTAVLAVSEIVAREMSSRIMQIRTEEKDRKWLQHTSSALREMSTSKKGISDSVTFSFKHAARSQSIDIRDPNRPVIAGPGGPTFVISDWLDYPASIKTIEDMWKDTDYLYFNERRDFWYYRLTREDLKRNNTTLSEYLKPVHDILRQNSDFQFLLKDPPVLLSDIAAIKVILTDRIRDPKQLLDLISR